MEKFNIPEPNSLDSMEGLESQNNEETIIDSENVEKLKEIEYLKSVLQKFEYSLRDLNNVLMQNNLIPVQTERIFLNDWVDQNDFIQEALAETFKRLMNNLNVINEYQEGRRIINTEQNYFEITVRMLDDLTLDLGEMINFFQNSKTTVFSKELIGLVGENIQILHQKKDIFFQKARALDQYLHG